MILTLLYLFFSLIAALAFHAAVEQPPQKKRWLCRCKFGQIYAVHYYAGDEVEALFHIGKMLAKIKDERNRNAMISQEKNENHD